MDEGPRLIHKTRKQPLPRQLEPERILDAIEQRLVRDQLFRAGREVAAGDIGDHFPPSDPQWRGASSDRFLAHAATLVAAAGYAIGNVDVTIICEAPRIGPHKAAMRARLAAILAIDIAAVSVKECEAKPSPSAPSIESV